MKTEDLPEIIEIIDDGIDAFGDRTHSITSTDDTGPRWVGPAAALALVALIGYGIATSASSASAPKVDPATSTIAPPPTTPRTTTPPTPTTTVEPPPVVPRYAANPPSQYSVQYAEDLDPDSDGYPTGLYQLWTDNGATTAAGSWFSIERSPGSARQALAIDAYRVQTDHESIAIRHTITGQSIAVFSPDGTLTITLTSFGFSDDEVVQLAQAIAVQNGEVVVDDPSLLAEYRMISSVLPWYAIQGIPAEQIFYTAGTDVFATISITVAPRPAADLGGDTHDRQVALQFLLANSTTFAVDGHVAVAGTVIGQDYYAVASWIAGDHIVTVSSTMPVQQLIDIASTVHEVSAAEWEEMHLQASRSIGDQNFGKFDETAPTAVSSGTDGDSKPWTIQASIVHFATRQQINWYWSGSATSSIPSEAPHITTAVDDHRTYVVADLPRAVPGTAQLEILRAGLDPVVVPFVDTGADIDRTFAGYAFSEPVAYTAQIIGADGTVLAHWPTV